MKSNIPTQLFVGHQEILLEKTEFFLQEQYCLNKEKSPSCYCNECRKIKNRQHESIVFITPEKNYIIKDIEVIFENTNLALDQNQVFFFILEKAQTLNIATANKLLKILEEPPTGYNFILHTNNKNSILPTIISRCHIKTFNKYEEININHPITTFFYNQNLLSPIDFDKKLREIELTDNQSIDLLHELIEHYAHKMIYLYKQNNSKQEIEHSKKILDFLKKQTNQLPQSGSSKLFWKNLYISFPQRELFLKN
ncbi:MAG: hypothetical protein ABIF12_00675 [bacterium]